METRKTSGVTFKDEISHGSMEIFEKCWSSKNVNEPMPFKDLEEETKKIRPVYLKSYCEVLKLEDSKFLKSVNEPILCL